MRKSGFRRLRAISIRDFFSGQGKALRDYLTVISGSGGRLVFSLVYFIILANSLSIADFGLFATASAAGVMLSRILALGFTATLYRIATVKRRLLGVYAAGFLLLSVISLPLLVAGGALVYLLFFRGDMAVLPFAVVVAAEALMWRPAETVVIVNNGLGRFGRAASLVILVTALRAAAAGLFAFQASHDLSNWSWLYLLANGLCLIIALLFYWPRQRLRLRPALYWRRLADALYVAGAEILFYLQMEFDKLLVLALGGPQLAGLYAIVMRLVDLTAIPIRTFTMLLVQKLMRAPEMLRSFKLRYGIESGLFLVSTLALLALAGLLYFWPSLLGKNIAEAAPLIPLALAIPGLRNLTEYQAELLFARGQTALRASSLALLAIVKGGLLAVALNQFDAAQPLILSLNGIFAVLYIVSTAITLWALSRPARRV